MPSNDAAKSLLKKISDMEKDVLRAEKEEVASGKNSKNARKRLIQLAHYYHLLQYIGGDRKADSENVEKYLTLARTKIQNAREYDGLCREIAEVNLIDEHIRAWNMAEYNYEKASKILCQMTITLMDQILQELSGFSILYKGKDRSGYFTLSDEIMSLNESYQECCRFLSVYDFCTCKIANFTGIEEYRHLPMEHERIIENGLPQRVVDAIEKLQEVYSKGMDYSVVDIRNEYEPQPPYYEDALEEQYSRAVSMYGDEVKAMSAFASLVIKTGEFYGACIKEWRND